ncbi:WecB/TagA/CpsF family glycosyltransferase [Cupriavidus sp. AcVe19-6a]|uniref:WecB/TagA/CpsF family glycosyltransferase n=1 Tax=Cupriavidus sp. AcVe19-6a TaxID=2821358 RepID=UPI001AEB5F1B|nr:WecB/TagA/CpsF family glycosyltransferase [Cupriavidus sp. AcVe19-6a]MBP0640133.1 WecB/TagA/CpsF family glycosyltransferase [Cupriavidus sp. AcVe19-6a]
MDRIGIDGGLLVVMLRLLRLASVERISFDMTSLAAAVLEQAVANEQRVFFIGSTVDSVTAASKILTDRYSGLRVCGIRDGYFSSRSERDETLKSIVFTSPDIVICGMGAPLQERFLWDLRKAGWQGTGFTCGGFIHQTAKAGRLNYYPEWITRTGLRWLYRIYDEPKLIKRYAVLYPKAIAYFVFDAVSLRFDKTAPTH